MYKPDNNNYRPQNKPFGTSDIPLNAKSMFLDEVNGVFRPFISITEAQLWFDDAESFYNDKFKDPSFDVIINTGGTIIGAGVDKGKILDGVNDVYWFRDFETLVLKTNSIVISNYYSKTEIDDILNSSGVGVMRITVTEDDHEEITIIDLIGKDVFDIASTNVFNVIEDPLVELLPEDVYFNSDIGLIKFMSKLAEGTKIRILYNKKANTMNSPQERNAATYSSMIEMTEFERPDTFYEYKVNEDEKNAGGNPAIYIRYNGSFIRNVPQQIS